MPFPHTSSEEDEEEVKKNEKDKETSCKEIKSFQINFMAFVTQLFNNRLYSDIKVSIQGEVLNAHRFVICQCDYFKKAFQNDGARIFAEGQSNSIEFNDGSAAAYWRVFEYLYKGWYSENACNNNIKDDPLLLKDIRVFVLADMFLLNGLKNTARSRLMAKLSVSKMNEEYIECVREVFATTCDADARKFIVSTTLEKVNGAKIVYNSAGKRQSSLLLDDHLLDLIREGGDFAVDYLLAADTDRFKGKATQILRDH
ncbi:hypothetical protein K3495_g8289 [Podosphaera aphanis]|nr:hypothetical protein K3495_g8289 [Podosphaera aphanis]